jgi:hypothetical protein
MATKDRTFPVRDLIIALLRDQNIHTGHWGLTVHFNASGTTVSPTGQVGAGLPGLAIAVTGVSLVAAKEGEEGSLDASLVNPARTSRPRKPTKQTLQ